MRRLLTGGIKAILAIAALSTAAHWILRFQREPAPSARIVAELPDPVTTGSIGPRQGDVDPVKLAEPDVTKGLDQRRLSELFAGTSTDKGKVQKAVAKR